MSGAGVQFSQFGGATAARQDEEPSRDVQELWFALARRRWSSVVLVPADDGIATGRLAKSLADVGGRLRDAPVTAIVADSVDYESVRMLADLQLRVTDDRAREAITVSEVPREIVPISGARPYEPEPPPSPRDGSAGSSGGQIIVAIPPVTKEPLGVAIAQAGDLVILCMQMGKTRLKGARRTIELIGAERIAGAVIVR